MPPFFSNFFNLQCTQFAVRGRFFLSIGRSASGEGEARSSVSIHAPVEPGRQVLPAPQRAESCVRGRINDGTRETGWPRIPPDPVCHTLVPHQSRRARKIVGAGKASDRGSRGPRSINNALSIVCSPLFQSTWPVQRSLNEVLYASRAYNCHISPSFGADKGEFGERVPPRRDVLSINRRGLVRCIYTYIAPRSLSLSPW